MKDWSPPSDWNTITTIDAHAAGEPLRIITGGLPPIPGNTILEKRRFAQDHLDHIRTALMWEPRGHADMYGCILTEPVTPDGDLGVLFLHNAGFSTMCGHAIIALTTVMLETGMVLQEEDQPILKIDSPAGRVTARAFREQDRVTRVSFQNVPAFVFARDQVVDVPELGQVRFDVAYGGAFYAFCRAEDFGFRLLPDEFSRLVDTGMRIKRAVRDSLPLQHPYEEDLGFLYGTIFYGPPADKDHFSRNVCIFADGEVDRSPTGTGVSARAALHFARREIVLDQSFEVESILGTCFSGKAVEATRYGSHEAVIPEVSGSAHITGRHEFYLYPDDPLAQGFFLRNS
jgi:trans-L-3-hydroxyproline dehydratase